MVHDVDAFNVLAKGRDPGAALEPDGIEVIGLKSGIGALSSLLTQQFGTPVAKTSLAKSKDPQTIPCPEVKGRYILLRALTEHGGNTFATVAELGILGE